MNMVQKTLQNEFIFSPERSQSQTGAVFSSKKASRRRLVLTPPSKPVSSRVNRYVSNVISSTSAKSVSSESYGATLESPFYAKQTSCTYWEQCFENLQYLGQGSFAQVYKVRNKEDGQLYAIKRSKEKFRGVSDRARKLQEVTFHETLGSHSNILRIIRAWEERDRLYIQTELCITNLLDYSEETQITQRMVWHFLYQISQALDCLHSQHYVHMDVKPENILITKEGTLKLCDFGILHDLRGTSLAQDGDARYLAREVLSGKITTAADMFSLGMTALELVSDFNMPATGDLWTDIRDMNIPPEITNNLSDIGLKKLLFLLINPDHTKRPSSKEVLDNSTIQQIRTETSPFAVMEKPMSPDPSPSTDCRTPTKKPKRPPYAVYNDDSEDDIRHSSCSRDLHLSPPPSLTIQGIVDPIRIRLFSTKDDDIEKMDNNIDQDCDNDHIFFRRSPVRLKLDSESGDENMNITQI